MKCKSLFSGKISKKKIIISLLCAILALGVLKAKYIASDQNTVTKVTLLTWLYDFPCYSSRSARLSKSFCGRQFECVFLLFPENRHRYFMQMSHLSSAEFAQREW